MRPIVIVMKVLLGLSMVWMFAMFARMIDFDIINFETISLLFRSLFNLVSYALFWFVFRFIWIGTYWAGAGPFIAVPSFNFGLQERVRDGFYQDIIRLWFGFPEDYTQASIDANVQTLTGNLYLLIFQIIGILMIVYGVLSIINTQDTPKYSIRCVTMLNLMVVVPLMLVGIENMVRVFAIDFNLSEMLGLYNLEAIPPRTQLIPYPLQAGIVYQKILPNFWEFLGSAIFQIALAAFVFLEISFQLNYIYQVTSPIEEREERLLYQLDSVKIAGKEAIIDLDRIKKEESKEKEQKKLKMDEEGNIIEEKKIATARQFISRTSTGFSNIKEMIERRKLEEKARKMVESLHDTRRLSNYLVKLLSADPDAENSLTAKSSAPTAGRLIRSTVIDVLVRLGGITLIVFFISQTPWVLINIFRVPQSIFESVELRFTAEVILTLLIPIILLFPIISLVIRGSKQQHLREKLKAEEERRSGIEEEEEELLAA